MDLCDFCLLTVHEYFVGLVYVRSILCFFFVVFVSDLENFNFDKTDVCFYIITVFFCTSLLSLILHLEKIIQLSRNVEIIIIISITISNSISIYYI